MNIKLLTKMSVDVCKACGRNATELYPIGKEKYLGINISEIICHLLQVNSEPTFGNSLICSSCITTLHLINEKIENLRSAFAPPAKQMHSDFGCSTPNKTNLGNQKPVPKIQQTRRSGNVETPKKTANSNKNASPTSPSKKTPNVKISAETVKEVVVAKKTAAAKKSSNGKVKLNAKSEEKNQDKIVSPTGVESSLSYEAIDDVHSSTRLTEESKKKEEKKFPKRRNTIYHFDCEFCDFQTGIIKGMQQHLIDIHDVKTPRLFECKQCSTKYTTKHGLDMHNKRHHPENGVETEKTTTSQEVEEEDEMKTTKQISPVKKSVSAKSPEKQITPDVRPSPQKLKTPSDIKKGLSFNSSHDIVSPQRPSPLSKPVNKKLYKCDECTMVCDSAFSLDLHRSLKHCFIANQSGCESVQQSDDDDNDDYNEATLGIPNGLNGSNLNEQEVPETDSDEQQVIPSPKKLQKTVPGISSMLPPKTKSDFNTKCDFCACIFDSPKNYANHLTTHHGIEEPRVFKCTHCDKTYKTQGVLRRHTKNVHEKINLDDIASDNENDNNETKEDSDIQVSCYEAMQIMEKHDDNASNSSMEFPFQIAKINALPVRKSLDQDRADAAVNQSPGKENITCPQCDQGLYSMFELKRHLKLEHNDSDLAIYVCELCPAKYKHNKNLKRHKKNFHSSDSIEATTTNHLIVSEEDNDRQHIKIQKKTKVDTPTKNNSFNADDTAIETETISKKKRKRDDSNGGDASLPKSPKKKKHSVSLKEDQLDEVDFNPQPQEITCSECNKSFISKGKLERHNKKHHTEKQLEFVACRVGSCHKQFKDQLYLDIHIKNKHPGIAIH